MRICIDSCVFIQGLGQSDPAAVRLLDLVLLIPRLAAQGVTRNLASPEQVSHFFRLFQARDFAFIVDEPVPRPLVDKAVAKVTRTGSRRLRVTSAFSPRADRASASGETWLDLLGC